jgi:hypothetical protein
MQAKKKPGRPRKTPAKEQHPKRGIMLKPTNVNNHAELMCDKTAAFKKIWGFYKLMAVDKNNIVFRKEDILILNRDHHGKNRIWTRIDASKMNYYYCKSELNIVVTCKNLETVMFTIDKTYNMIFLHSRLDCTQTDIRAVLQNDMEIDETHKIELICDQGIPRDKVDDFSVNDYTISFKLPCKYFKKIITDIKASSNQLTIKQDGKDEPLIFEYIGKSKKVKSEYIVNNNKNIDFKSNLKPDETFQISVKIDYIRPISQALLGDITIYAKEDHPVLFVIPVDKNTKDMGNMPAIEMRVLTEIVNDRLI